jgi:hypothetical protein
MVLIKERSFLLTFLLVFLIAFLLAHGRDSSLHWCCLLRRLTLLLVLLRYLSGLRRMLFLRLWRLGLRLFARFVILRYLRLASPFLGFYCCCRFLRGLLCLLLILLLQVSLLLFSELLFLESLLEDLIGNDRGSRSVFLGLTFSVRKFLELGEVEAVHVVGVWVDTARQVKRRVEPLLLVASKARFAHFAQTCVDELHIASAQCIVNYPFVLLH